MTPKFFLFLAIFILLTACAPVAAEILPTQTAVPAPSATPIPPTATPDLRVGGFIVLDGKIYAAADDGALTEQEISGELRVAKLSLDDNTVLALDESGEEAARYENGVWVEVVRGFFSEENVEKLGTRFEVEGQHINFTDPVSAEKITVPMEISEDGAIITIMVNGAERIYAVGQFVVFEPLNRGEDRMLVLEDDAGRVVWNEYSGQWIEDGWEKVDKLSDQMMRDFDALVWARLNGSEFEGATNTGKYGMVETNAGDNSELFIKKTDGSTEKFWRSIMQWQYVGGNGKERTMSVLQILNVNGKYSYILELGGVQAFGLNPSYFKLELGYGKAFLTRFDKFYGSNSLIAELRFQNKIYVNGQPNEWTIDCLKAWQTDITAFEKNYYLMRDPDK